MPRLEVSVSCWREKVKKGAWHFLDLDGGDQTRGCVSWWRGGLDTEFKGDTKRTIITRPV